MRKIGIAINEWKSSVFEAHLTKGGFTFEKIQSETVDMLLLMVETDDLAGLEAVVYSAETECALLSIPPSTLH